MTKFSVPSLEAVTAPVVKAGKLNVASLEKLTAFNFGLLQSYSDLGLSRLKAATDVTDLASLKAYGESSVEVAKDFGAKVQADAKAYADLLAGVGAEYKDLVKVA